MTTSPPPITMGFDDLISDQAALDWTIAEAQARHLPVRLAEVWENISAGSTIAMGTAGANAPMESEAVVQARKAQDAVKAAGLEVSTEIFTGSPALAYVKVTKGADTFVMRADDGRQALNVLMGKTVDEVVSRAHSTVVLVRPRSEGGHGVVVVVDESRSAAKALQYAVEHAAVHGLPLLAVYPQGAAPGGIAELATTSPTVAVTTQQLGASPLDELYELSGSAELVVVGAKSRAGARKLSFHSFAHGVVKRTSCTTAVVR